MKTPAVKLHFPKSECPKTKDPLASLISLSFTRTPRAAAARAALGIVLAESRGPRSRDEPQLRFFAEAMLSGDERAKRAEAKRACCALPSSRGCHSTGRIERRGS
jgi:hypothetical protein